MTVVGVVVGVDAADDGVVVARGVGVATGEAVTGTTVVATGVDVVGAGGVGADVGVGGGAAAVVAVAAGGVAGAVSANSPRQRAIQTILGTVVPLLAFAYLHEG